MLGIGLVATVRADSLEEAQSRRAKAYEQLGNAALQRGDLSAVDREKLIHQYMDGPSADVSRAIQRAQLNAVQTSGVKVTSQKLKPYSGGRTAARAPQAGGPKFRTPAAVAVPSAESHEKALDGSAVPKELEFGRH